MENNQNYVATIFNAMFPILNTAQVYVGFGVGQEDTKLAFYEAFRKCQKELQDGTEISIGPEFFIQEFKNWAKKSEEIIFMSLLSYHPEKFFPQQIDALPEESEFWEGMYQKEQWEQFDESQHPLFDIWVQEMQDVTQEMWQEF
ncbi:MAG: hypothetical protein EBS19_14320 [Spirochaetia bacterium]|nr:hypothetical protein [Spirochaetia bacterium]